MTDTSNTCMIRPTSTVAMLARICAVAAGLMFSAQPCIAQNLDDAKPPLEREREGQRERQREQQDQQDDKNADDRSDLTRAELKKRFESRHERLNKWKDDGLIGETFEGYIEELHDGLLTGEQRDLLAVENADRKTLYGLIANRVDEGEEKVPPRVVAQRNARRKFEKAEPGHYLKMEEGYWTPKRDEERHDKLTRYKRDDLIGETWEGYVESIDTRPSDEVKSLVEAENRARRELYESIAQRLDKASAEQVGRKIGQDTRENLPPGHSYKGRNDGWEKRQARER
jgi:uncharacterized protein YdbL (DUF1318 family)